MKTLEKQDIEALPLIGQGASGQVYRYGEDKVLKLYRDSWTEAMVSSAFSISKSVSSGGVVTAVPWEMVRCGGRYGIVYDRLTGDPLPVHIGGDIEARYTAGERMGGMLAAVHALKPDPEVFPSLREMFSGILGTISEYFTEEQIGCFLDFVDRIPGGPRVLHGDFHENNIMVCGGEFYLIDLDSMCIGSPIFDLMQSYCTYRTPLPEEYRRYMNLTDEALDEFLLRFLGSYFNARRSDGDGAEGGVSRETLLRYDEVFTKASDFMRFFAPLYMKGQPEEQLRDYVKSNIRRIFGLMGELENDFGEIEIL